MARRELERSKARLLRGRILRILRTEHPRTVNEAVLHNVLDDLGFWASMEQVRSALVYLKDRSYVHLEVLRDAPGGHLKVRRAQITAKGIDLLEGTSSDEGVEVE